MKRFVVYSLLILVSTSVLAQPTEPTLKQQGMVKYHSMIMQDFIDAVNNYCNDEVNNVHSMFRYAYEPNKADPGKSAGLTLMSLFLRGLGALEVPGAAVIGNALASMNSEVTSNPPADLNNPLAGISDRLKRTSLVIKDTLGAIYDNPVKYWNDTLHLPYEITKTDGSKVSYILVKELGGDTLLSKYTKSFNILVEKSKIAYDRMLAQRELQTRFRIVVSKPDMDPWKARTNRFIDPNDWHQDYNNAFKRVQVSFTGQDMYPMLGYCTRANGVDPQGGTGSDWERFRRIAADFMSKNIGSYVLANRQIMYVQFYLTLNDVCMNSRTCFECPLAAHKDLKAAKALDAYLFHDNGDGFERNNGGLAHHYEVFSQWDIPGGNGTWLPEAFTTSVYEDATTGNGSNPLSVIQHDASEVKIRLANAENVVSLCLYDMGGNIITHLSEPVGIANRTEFHVSTESMAPGIYIVVLQTTEGPHTATFMKI